MSYKKYEVRVHDDGTKEWFLNDKHHREDGPAIEYPDGTKCWYLNGKCHREDGPAYEDADGSNEWFLNGKYLTEAEFNKKMGPSSCHGKTVEIDGKKYKLVEL
jgi:hypothetical protein